MVTGFSIAGSTQVYRAGSSVALNDPLTGAPIGTLVISGSGAYIFTPVPGFTGPAPAINIYSQSGNAKVVSSLTIDVLPGLSCPPSPALLYSLVPPAPNTHTQTLGKDR